MPSLFRLLFTLGLLGGLGFGALYALATLVSPQPREMTVTVPLDQLNRNH